MATKAKAGDAVLVNLTMTGGSNGGYVTADKCSDLKTGPQSKSNGNHGSLSAVANAAVVPVDADGLFCLYNSTEVHLLADLQGVYSVTGALSFEAVPPTRLLDTRGNTPQGAYAISRVTTPYAGAAAALVNLTMVPQPGQSGYVTADKCSALTAGPQTKSNGNFANFVAANVSVVGLDPDGAFCVLSDVAVDRIVDIQGVYAPGGQTRLASQEGRRLVDTRSTERPAANTIVRVDTGLTGTSSVLVNLVAVNAQAGGYVTADRCSALTTGEQSKSNGNYVPGRPTANLSVVPVDPDGSFCLYTSASSDLLADLQGAFSSTGTLKLDLVSPTRLLDTRVGP